MQGRMPLYRCCQSVVALLAILWGGFAHASAQQCVDAARRTADASSVPFAVLLAITQTETGRGADAQPWPWAINVEGEGQWFDNGADALVAAKSYLARGTRSFDVGCFQINYHWHGAQFTSLEAMFDPTTNATYAARFLTDLYAETGDWSRAAGAYHSRTPIYANRYRARFDRFYAAALDSLPELYAVDTPPPALPRVNDFPLLRTSEGTRAVGSLVPLPNEGSP